MKSACLFAALSLCGCPSAPLMTSAQPVGHLKAQTTLSPGVMGIDAAVIGTFPNPFKGSEKSIELSKMYYLPDVAVGARLGIWDYFDIGIHTSGYGRIGFDLKGAPYFNKWFCVALAPGVGFGGFGTKIIDANYVDLTVPILVDLAPAHWLRFTLAPRYRAIFSRFKDGRSGEPIYNANFHFLGGGASVELWASRFFAFVPHATVDQLLQPPEVGLEGVTVSTRFRLFSAGVGFRIAPGRTPPGKKL